jgi:uncharacterized membrane protein
VTASYGDPQDRHQATDPQVEAELEAEANGTERVITFSDAVVAIAITLLALALAVPDLKNNMTDGQVLHLLGQEWPEYLSFLISFVVIGNLWASHRRVFRYVGSWNGVVGRLNLYWLLMVVLTPFGARLLAASGGFAIRFSVYVVIQVIAQGCLALMSLELARAHLLRPGAPAKATHPDILPFIAFCITFLVSIPVAFATARYGDWAYAVWGCTGLTTRLLRRVVGTGRHEG